MNLLIPEAFELLEVIKILIEVITGVIVIILEPTPGLTVEANRQE